MTFDLEEELYRDLEVREKLNSFVGKQSPVVILETEQHREVQPVPPQPEVGDPRPQKKHKGDSRATPPLPLVRKTDMGEPYPVEALGPIMAPATEVLMAVIQAPDAVCAQSVLSVACLCVQGSGDVLVDGRKRPLSENFLSICDRSGRKTSTDTAVAKEVRAWEEERFREYKKIFKAYKDDLEAYQAQQKKVLGNKKLSLEEQQGELSVLRESEPERPVEPVILLGDTTYEGMIKRFVHGRPSKGLFADEGGVFAGGYSMAPEKVLYSAAGYSRFWDGASHDRVRAGSDFDTLYGRRLCMHLMMQDKIAVDFFNNRTLVSQGLLSRFFVAYPQSKTGGRQYVAEDPSLSAEMVAYNSRVRELLGLALPLKVDPSTGQTLNELDPPTIEPTKAAKNLWIEFYHAVEENCGAGRLFETVPGFAGKAAEHCLRLAGIFALFEKTGTIIIERDHIKRATTVVEYYLNERVRIRNIAAPDKGLELAQDLLEWIKIKGKKMVTLQEVYQTGPYRLRTAKEASATIKILVDHFWLVPIQGCKNQWRVA